MKNTLNSKTRLLLALCASALLLAPLPVPLSAQSQTERKIRLMADALRARDQGDLVLARDNLEELIRLVPDDATIRRLLDSVNAALASGAVAPAAFTAESVAPVEEVPRVRFEPENRAPARAPTQAQTMAGAAPAEAPRPDPAPTAAEAEAEIEALTRAEEQRINALLAEAGAQMKEARRLARDGRHDTARANLQAAIDALPLNALTARVVDDLTKQRNALLLEKAQHQLKQGDPDGARATLDAYAQTGLESRAAHRFADRLARAELDPPLPPIAIASPQFLPDRREVAKLVAKGRAQYLAGDADGAQETFRTIEAMDPDNPEAKSFLLRIARDKAAVGAMNREKTRAQLLEEVAKAWQRPGVYTERNQETDTVAGGQTPLAQKLASISIPSVSFNNVELSRVVHTLSDISTEFDTTGATPRGVNIVVIDPGNKNPTISITLRNLSLKRVLDFITDSVGYQYEVQADAVVVRPGGETSTLDTAFFPVTRSTVIRMTGISGSQSAPVSNDPFAPAPTVSGSGAGGGEAQALRLFLQQAGVNFDGVPGSSLAYDGSAMIVTQTTRNVERIRNILNRYNDVRQVEIEAKFMEVQEGALEELGVNWQVTRRGVPQFNPSTGEPIIGSSGRQIFVPQEVYNSGNRSLANAFSSSVSSSDIIIDGQSVASLAPPMLPGAAPLGSGAGPLATISGMVGEFNVDAVVRALSQKSGTDLLSAPKLTVLSGNPATITVAQEMRYPQSYGEIQSAVGSSGRSSGGDGVVGGGVTITAGTPQEFTTRNVGVELRVTPTVEEDDYSISLDLAPEVTEFEGFIEYGGPSVAISGARTVTVPPGFYQPIFSVRKMNTKVTIWDGATLVMGGLTREDVKKVNDKVPILGDIPLIGRAFRSKGESTQKRNLLIFVTANLVSPGGSPKKQTLRGVAPSTMFQNPTIVTPASSEHRVRGK